MGRRSVPSLGCSLGHLVTAILLAVLALSCRAQSALDSTPVTITIGNNNISTAILPDETSNIIIKAQLTIRMATLVPSDFATIECSGSTLCDVHFVMLNLAPGESQTLEIILENDEDINQTLTITIRENLNATCKEYPVPMNFTANTNLYMFTCEPLAPNGTDILVRWRKFRQLEKVRQFMERPGGEFIHDDEVFTVGDNGWNLTVDNSRAEAESVVYYYVPSFVMEAEEVVTAETVIFLGPKIMGEVPEFSSEVIFNSGRARNFTGFSCETDTFPPASISWVVVSEDFPCTDEDCGANVTNLTGIDFEFMNFGSEENLTLSLNAKLHLLNLQFDQDGEFTCTADNGQASSTRSFNLRVKSPLRPLWPTLGIIGVFLLVALLMLFSYVVEKIVERKKLQGSRSPYTSPDHTDQEPRSSVSSSGGPSNTRVRNHSAVKRLSSNKPLIDESTL